MKFIIQFFISGILTSLLFPPFSYIPFGFFVFPFIFYLLNDQKYITSNYQKHFISGFFYGLGFFLNYLFWLREPFLLDEMTAKYSILSFILILYCSLYFGIIFFILKFVNNIFAKFIIFPLLILSAEIVCSKLSYGFPWFSFSLINSVNYFGVSIVYYIGAYSLSYLTIIIYLFPSIFLNQNNKYKKLLIKFYCVIFLSIFLLLLQKNNDDLVSDKYLDVTAIQLNKLNYQNSNERDLKSTYQEILLNIKETNSSLIIFGENNFPYLMNDFYVNEIQKLLKSNKTIIIGGTRKDNQSFFNSFYLIKNNSYKVFDKKILVPFGEFIPYRNFFKFMEFIAGTTDFKIGSQNRLLRLNDKTKIIPIICYEIVYFWKIINENNSDGNIIINITNDSWFGNFSGPYQHFYFTRMRAAEFNKPLIRVSNNGISAGINSDGSIIDFIELNVKGKKKFKVNIENQNNLITFHKFVLYFIYSLSLIVIIFTKRND